MYVAWKLAHVSRFLVLGEYLLAPTSEPTVLLPVKYGWHCTPVLTVVAPFLLGCEVVILTILPTVVHYDRALMCPTECCLWLGS